MTKAKKLIIIPVFLSLGYRQAVRHQVLVLTFGGSNPPTPSTKKIFLIYREVEQLVARRAHNPEAAGSSPALATKFLNYRKF